MHIPEVASCFLLFFIVFFVVVVFFYFGRSGGNPAEDYSSRGSLSTWRNCSEEVMKEQENMGIFAENKIIKQPENP